MSDTTMKAIATQIKEATAAGTNTAAKVGGLLENLCDEKLHEDYSAHIGNIKRYGAVGNGSTDDTAAFTAALADSTIRTIYIPNGTYLCDGFTIADAAIEVRAINPKSNIQAWADAQGITILNPELLEQDE